MFAHKIGSAKNMSWDSMTSRRGEKVMVMNGNVTALGHLGGFVKETPLFMNWKINALIYFIKLTKFGKC